MELEKLMPNSSLGLSFKGETEDGKKYIVSTNHNDHGNWTLLPEEIYWENEKGTEEQIQKIIDDFLNEMNN